MCDYQAKVYATPMKVYMIQKFENSFFLSLHTVKQVVPDILYFWIKATILPFYTDTVGSLHNSSTFLSVTKSRFANL